MKFLQKGIDKFKDVRQTKVQKRSIYGKKKKAWKRTQMPFTLTEGLAVTDKG